MQYVIYLALLASLFVILKTSPGRALLAVYLPTLLLLPDTFHAITPGLPDPSFNSAAMLPIMVAALFRYAPRWRPSVADGLVAGYTIFIAYSEFFNAGYSEAQNLMFGALTQVAGPYFVARWVIDAEGLHVAMARRFAMMVCAVAVICLYEFAYAWNPILFFFERLFFPGQGLGWGTTLRHGLTRIAGPYAHAILAGIMMVVAYRLSRWLEWGGHWEPKFRWLPGLPGSKGRLIAAMLVVGSLMTVARGPWLGAFIGAIFVNAARLQRRRRALIVALVTLIAIAVPGYIGFQAYIEVKPGVEMTMSQETALYRKVLFEKYVEIALERPMLGWGRNGWPKLRGMDSIDNYYLLLALMHGVVAAGLFAAILVWMGLRLVRKGLAEPEGVNSLAFTFAGILVAVSISLVTVYLGENVIPTLFLIIGWAEGYIQGRGCQAVAGPAATAPSEAAPERFRRVIT